MHNHNNDRPDQAFVKSFRDRLASYKEIMLESSKQQDSVAIWLVGMSTGSIALIISQFTKLDPTLYPALKAGVFFLTATIIFGLLFRVLHLILQKSERINWQFSEDWLVGYSKDLTESPTIKSMIESFSEFVANLEGISVEKYKQKSKNNKSVGVRKRLLKTFCDISYILICISFAVSVLIISYNFIKTDFKSSSSAATADQKAISPSKQVQPDQTDESD